MGFAWIYLYAYCFELGLQIQVVRVAGLGENVSGGGAEVVADEEGGGGVGNGRQHFGDGFCWRKLWFIEKQ